MARIVKPITITLTPVESLMVLYALDLAEDECAYSEPDSQLIQKITDKIMEAVLISTEEGDIYERT